MQDFIQGVVIDHLFALAADAVEQADQCAVEWPGGFLDQLGLGLVTQCITGVGALGLAG